MTVKIPTKKFTVREYRLMAEADIIKEGDRLELIDGEIVEMSPVGKNHATCVRRLMRSTARTFSISRF